MKYILASLTDKGSRKKQNQDSILLVNKTYGDETCILAVVCDGMGGLEKGEAASAEVIHMFSAWFNEIFPQLNEEKRLEEFEDILYESWETLLQTAHKMLRSYGELNKIKTGTTATAMLLCRGQYFTAHVGDSRIYEITEQVIRLTQDQTLANINMHDEPDRYSRMGKRISGVLLQGLGASQIIRPVYKNGEIRAGAVYLLCSDGMGNRVKDEELADCFFTSMPETEEMLRRRGEAVIRLARERGEKDDISLLMICTG